MRTKTVEVIQPETQIVSTSSSIAYKLSQLIWFIFGLIELLLAIRILLLLLGARLVGFAGSIYDLSRVFVAPFQNIFPSPSVSGAYFDSAAILAMIVWGLVAWGITALIELAVGD